MEDPRVSIEEVKNAVQYLRGKGIAPNRFKVAKLMGICADFKKRGDIQSLFLK